MYILFDSTCSFVCVGYEVIFQTLENVQGSVEAKKLFVRDIIKEAERFRKKQLIQYLEDWLGKLGPVSSSKTELGRNIKNNSKLSAGQQR